MSTEPGSLSSNKFQMSGMPLQERGFPPSPRNNSQNDSSSYSYRTLQPTQSQAYNQSFATTNSATLSLQSNTLIPTPHSTPNQYPLAAPLATIQKNVENSLKDEVAPVRLAGHISVLVVAALVLIISQMNLSSLDVTPNWLFSNVKEGTSSLSNGLLGSLSLSKLVVPFTESAPVQAESVAAAVAFSESNTPQESQIRQHTIVYSVLSGDTVLKIAEKFNLQPETIQWSNLQIAKNPDLLRIGDELIIPPVDGILYTIKSGDTLLSVADSHRIELDVILSFAPNGISDPSKVQPGKEVMLPGATPAKQIATYLPYNVGSKSIAAVPSASGRFGWPYRGAIGQRYWSGHRALDIGGWTGHAVIASDSGKVAIAAGGWNGGYGRHVIIDHGNGFATLYAHLNTIYVRQGQAVAKGVEIGSLGSTGNSTGPHLHFEIRYNGKPQNPYNYLD